MATVNSYNDLAAQLELLASNPPADLLKNDEAGKAIRHRLTAAANSLIPKIETTEDTIQRINYLPLELAIARVGKQMGLFETLAKATEPVSTEKIAHLVQGEVATLDRLLRYMASLSYIREVGICQWAATEITKTLAIPGVSGGLVHNFDTIVPTLLALPGFLTSKSYKNTWDPSDTAFSVAHDNLNAFAWLGRHPERMQAMGLWMTVQRYASELWLTSFPFKDVLLRGMTDPSRTVFVDVGGGVGHQCKAVLDAFPELKGRIVLQDQQEALEDAPNLDGVTKIPIDFFESQPVKGAKAYYLRNVLHDFPDSKALTILNIIRSAMASDSLILIDEMCIPARGAHKIATQVDITMMINLAGEERSEARWHELLGKAGLELVKIYSYQKELGDSVLVAKLT